MIGCRKFAANAWKKASLFSFIKRVKIMIKLIGKNNDLITEEGKITRIGYAVMTLSTILGLCVLLTGRYMYGKSLEKKQ